MSFRRFYNIVCLQDSHQNEEFVKGFNSQTVFINIAFHFNFWPSGNTSRQTIGDIFICRKKQRANEAEYPMYPVAYPSLFTCNKVIG